MAQIGEGWVGIILAVTLKLNNFSFLIFGQTPWELLICLIFLEMYVGTVW